MGKIGNHAIGTKNKVDAELANQEAELLLRSSTKLDELKPRVGDKDAFDKLVAAVAESTRKNESVVAFQQRLQGLGKGVLAIAKTVSGLLA